MGIFAVSNENDTLKKSIHLKAIQSIRESIEEINYSRYVHHILLLCNNQSLDSQIVEEAYSLFKDLLPLLNE